MIFHGNIWSPALFVITCVNIVFFVGLGIWSLHQRFKEHKEWTLRTQALVLFIVLFFYIIEISTLRSLLIGENVYFIFAFLGLLAAGLALYGHIVVSFFTRLLVDLVAPDNPANASIPRLGPAEILEHEQDWEGALNEYYVLAHIYPGNAVIYTRIANNLLRLGRSREAAQWFERSIQYTQNPGDALVLLRRLWDVYEQAGEHANARQAAFRFIHRFPDYEASPLLLEQLSGGKKSPKIKSEQETTFSTETSENTEVYTAKDRSALESNKFTLSDDSRILQLQETPIIVKNKSKRSSTSIRKKRNQDLKPLEDNPLNQPHHQG